MSNYKVSVICNTYNHEKYIKQALESFLIQLVDFNYEILIHDDASTDRTPIILKEYERKYPDKLKVIYQTDNQYSKGFNVNQINTSRSLGEYIAICEGDDYWIDPNKLQKQVDYLDQNQDCQLVVHGSLKVNANNPVVRRKWLYTNESRILSAEEIIEHRAIVAAHNSFMYRNNEYLFPEFFKNLGVSDITRMLYFSTQGYVYFISEIMSVYRVGIVGSWSDRVRLNETRLIKHYEKEQYFYDSFNKFTDYIYDKSIQSVILELEYLKQVLLRDYKGINSMNYESKKRNSLYKNIVFIIQKCFPNLFKLLQYYRFKYWV